MYIAAVWASLFLVHTGRTLVYGEQIPADVLSSQITAFGIANKRGNVAEPTCEELRAMWRYSKRQSRAAETTNELPMYRDPFSYNMWEIYPERLQPSYDYRGTYGGQARSRGAGGAPIYGRIVHKAPAGSRLRNGMPDRSRAFEEVTRLYGTVNRQPPSPRRRFTSFRVGGGGPSPISQVPQAGSFQHLKELIRNERARELQEQRMAEEVAARAAALKEMTNSDLHSNPQGSRNRLYNSLQSYQEPKSVNYDFSPAQYVSDLGETFSRGDQYGREYMLR